MTEDARHLATLVDVTVRQIEAARYILGGRVRVLPDGELPDSWVGREGTVVEVGARGAWPIRVALDSTAEHLGGIHRFAPDQLEKVPHP